MIEVKKALMEQLPRLMEVENLTFPPDEAAKEETFRYRIERYPFWFRTAKIGDQVVGYLCGRPVKAAAGQGIEDAMYEAEDYPEGKTFAFLGIGVEPAYQRQGIGELLIRTIIFLCEGVGIERIVLACKEEKVHYYARFGFEELGLSKSQHGGAVWYDMELNLTHCERNTKKV